jgi:hypothetical protein
MINSSDPSSEGALRFIAVDRLKARIRDIPRTVTDPLYGRQS